MSAISALTSLPSALTSSSTSAPNTQLNQTDFLKLLMAQMQNQDPTSPTSSTDFVTQMAQFSSVQGITQLNQSINNLVSMQSLTQGVSLIGKTVTYTDAAGKTASGTVGAVTMTGGQPQLVINNTNVKLTQVQSVQATAKKSPAVSAASSGS